MVAELLDALRGASGQLARLQHLVGASVELRGIDLECLDLIAREGAMPPTVVGRALGIHPASLTTIIDRLEDGGWVQREADAADRRKVLLRALTRRGAELRRGFAPMSTRLRELSADYTDDELNLIIDFLRRTTSAARDATSEQSRPRPRHR